MEQEFLGFYPNRTEEGLSYFEELFVEKGYVDDVSAICGSDDYKKLYDKYIKETIEGKNKINIYNDLTYGQDISDFYNDLYGNNVLIRGERYADLEILFNHVYTAYSNDKNITDKQMAILFKKELEKAIKKGANIDFVRLKLAKDETEYLRQTVEIKKNKPLSKDDREALNGIYSSMELIDNMKYGIEMSQSPYDILLNATEELVALKSIQNRLLDSGKIDPIQLEKVENDIKKQEDKIAKSASKLDPNMLKHVIEEKRLVIQEEYKQREIKGEKVSSYMSDKKYTVLKELERQCKYNIKFEADKENVV